MSAMPGQGAPHQHVHVKKEGSGQQVDQRSGDKPKSDDRGQGNPRERNDKNHGHGGHDRGGRGAGFQGAPRGNYNRGGFNKSQSEHRDEQPSKEDEGPSVPLAEKKFTGRCRLFVGNFPNDMTEEKFKELITPHGQFTELFLNPSKGFGFIRLDTRANAEAAKAAIDGLQMKGRMLRCRFATHGAALKVKHLTQHVTNELLEQAFSIFGELERAVVIVDDRGKSTGEAIVEFARKPGYNNAMKRINDGVYLLGLSPKPVVVEPLEQRDDADGLLEKYVSKTPDFAKEREQSPRFVQPGSFEFEMGNKWKDLYQTFKLQEENLKRQFDEAASKLEFEMENAAMEHQANMMRQDLLRRQDELRRLEEQQQLEIQRRLDQRQQMEDVRRQEQEQEVRRREMDLRRQQDMFVQERGMRGDARRDERGNAPPMQPPPAPPAALGLDRNRGQRGGMVGANAGPLAEMGLMHDAPGGMMGNAGPRMRQSRFDQLPNFQGDHGNAMGGGNIPNMMGRAGGNMGRMAEHSGGAGAPEQMGERRNRGRGGGGGGGANATNDDYYDNAKRPRRY